MPAICAARRGKAVAMLVPGTPPQRRERSEVIKDLLKFGKGRKLEGMSIRGMIDEGRRF